MLQTQTHTSSPRKELCNQILNRHLSNILERVDSPGVTAVKVNNHSDSGGTKPRVPRHSAPRPSHLPDSRTRLRTVNTSGYSPDRSLESTSSEFQSLKLESMSTVEEFKAVSETFSSVLEKEIAASKKYSEMVTGSPPHGLESGSLLSYDDELDPAQSAFLQQVKFFSHMKQFLLSQQTSLRQNLDALRTKLAKKNKVSLKMQRCSDSSEKCSTRPGEANSESSSHVQHREYDALRQWGSPSSGRSRNSVPICPVCGLEFDNPDSEVLEEHVAGHWCSSDNNG